MKLYKEAGVSVDDSYFWLIAGDKVLFFSRLRNDWIKSSITVKRLKEAFEDGQLELVTNNYRRK